MIVDNIVILKKNADDSPLLTTLTSDDGTWTFETSFVTSLSNTLCNAICASFIYLLC